MRSVNRWTVLAVLSGALALISLDNTIVNVALPRLQQDLDATTAQLQWVVDAYSVMFAGSLLIAGSLGDRFGRRRMLVIGLAIFTVGSLAAALSVNASQLTVCRGLMGIGGACIMPSTLSVLVQVFPDRTERARAIGIWAAVAGLGVAIGPIIGGVLLEYFDWQAIFLVNPPIALALLAAVLILVPESCDPQRPRLDLIGAALSAVGLIALVVTIIEIPDAGLGTFTLTSAGVAIASLVGFVWWEHHSPRPMLPMQFFANRLFSTAIVLVGVVYFALMGAMFFLPQFLQLVQGMSPLESGFAMLPGALGLLLASVVSPRLAEHFGARRLVMSGMAIVTIGLLGFSSLSPTTAYAFIACVFGLMGIGLGLTLPQATNAVLASVPTERSGMGSAVNDAVAELGGAFGVAILGATMSITYRQHIEAEILAAGDRISLVPDFAVQAARESLAAASIAAGQIPSNVAGVYSEVAGDAFVSGMGWAMTIGAVIAAAGVVIAWRYFPASVELVEE
ncbi:MAG: MFS transporter [Actinomycetota bacterium]|nr:MFS transporter [Actinomycetota bacterium]